MSVLDNIQTRFVIISQPELKAIVGYGDDPLFCFSSFSGPVVFTLLLHSSFVLPVAQSSCLGLWHL